MNKKYNYKGRTYEYDYGISGHFLDYNDIVDITIFCPDIDIMDANKYSGEWVKASDLDLDLEAAIKEDILETQDYYRQLA